MNMEQRFCKVCHQVCLDGRMTSETVEDLRSDWMKNVDLYSDMVIDLSGVECIDLVGVDLMLQVHKKAVLGGKRIEFIGFSLAIKDAMYVYHRLAGLEREMRSRSRLTNDKSAA